jgi:multicomponent K+:H+ antiporter subunit E
MNRWLPNPILSAVLWLTWLWLHDTLEPGHIVLGAVLAFALPLFTQRFHRGGARAQRPLEMVSYLGIVLYDIVIANVQVAILVLGPRSRLKSGFARVPLDLKTNHAITVFASTISLTPGTVSVDVTPDRSALVVHYLSSEDPAALVRTVKERYEARVRRIFEC